MRVARVKTLVRSLTPPSPEAHAPARRQHPSQVAVVFEHQPKPPIESEAIEIAAAPRAGPEFRGQLEAA